MIGTGMAEAITQRTGMSLRGVIFVAALASLVSTALGVLWTLLRTSQRRADLERQNLQATTESLRRRNDQLTALHNVFSEINETLTMRYVIATTLRESLKIMHADMVTLRKREGD